MKNYYNFTIDNEELNNFISISGLLISEMKNIKIDDKTICFDYYEINKTNEKKDKLLAKVIYYITDNTAEFFMMKTQNVLIRDFKNNFERSICYA